jgi:hypothetical protein
VFLYSYFLETEARSDFILSQKEHITKVKYPGALNRFLTPPPVPTPAPHYEELKTKTILSYGHHNKGFINPGLHPSVEHKIAPPVNSNTVYSNPLEPGASVKAAISKSLGDQHQTGLPNFGAPTGPTQEDEDTLRQNILQNTLAQRRKTGFDQPRYSDYSGVADPSPQQQRNQQQNQELRKFLGKRQQRRRNRRPRPRQQAAHVDQQELDNNRFFHQSPASDVLFRGNLEHKARDNKHYNRRKYHR